MGLIRDMVLSDVAEVAALEAAEQPRPWSEQVFRDELQEESRIYVVAGEPISAFGGIMVIGDEAHVTNLLVAPAHRRSGLGRTIVETLIWRAVDAGARHLTLEVRMSNEPARRLYSSLGMAPVGVRPGYYGDDDALIMWAHDIDKSDRLERAR